MTDPHIGLLAQASSPFYLSASKDKKLTEKEYRNPQKRYRTIITRGDKELPVIPEKPSGQRDQMANKGHNPLIAIQMTLSGKV